MNKGPASSSPSTLLEDELAGLGGELVQAIGALIAKLPGRVARPQELARALSINKDLASRVLVSLRKGDPFSAIHHLPGANALRQLVCAAEKQGVDAETAAHAKSAIDIYDRFVRQEFGARSDLQGLLSAHVPVAREYLESTSRQAVFRGWAGIRGLEVGVLSVTFLVHPSRDDESLCDTSVINANLGIRRSRPNVPLTFSSRWQARDGTLITESPLMPEFCTPETPPILSKRDGEYMRHTLTGSDFGRQQVSDLVMAEHFNKNHPVDPISSGAVIPRWFYATVNHPVRLIIFDVLVHHDVWSDTTPQLATYDSAVHGDVTPDDDSRATDRLHLLDTLKPFNPSRNPPNCPELPQWTDMAQSMCDHRGWDLNVFRGYRVQSQYPLYGSQYCQLFFEDGFTQDDSN